MSLMFSLRANSSISSIKILTSRDWNMSLDLWILIFSCILHFSNIYAILQI